MDSDNLADGDSLLSRLGKQRRALGQVLDIAIGHRGRGVATLQGKVGVSKSGVQRHALASQPALNAPGAKQRAARLRSLPCARRRQPKPGGRLKDAHMKSAWGKVKQRKSSCPTAPTLNSPWSYMATGPFLASSTCSSSH